MGRRLWGAGARAVLAVLVMGAVTVEVAGVEVEEGQFRVRARSREYGRLGERSVDRMAEWDTIWDSGELTWHGVVEPYRDTVLFLEDMISLRRVETSEEEEDANTEKVQDIAWYVDDTYAGSGAQYEFAGGCSDVGASIAVRAVMTFPDAGTYTVETTLACKYVRRELRQLLDMDRERFMNAISVLQRVPTQVGRKLYGDKFKSMAEFTRVHLTYGGNDDCDFWHTGASFILSHTALSLQFEKALQAVDPIIALPYWDSTIDTLLYGDNWRSSPLWAPDWFGATDPGTQFNHINKGRWAYSTIMQNAENFSSITNPFKLLRSSWNTDSTPFVTRSQKVGDDFSDPFAPHSCSEIAGGFDLIDWDEFSLAAATQLHGHVHLLLGGHWKHSINGHVKAHVDELSDAMIDFVELYATELKVLYRAGFIVCPEDCTGLSEDECACSCPASARKGLSSYDVLRLSGVLSRFNFFFDMHGDRVSGFLDKPSYRYRLPGYTHEETGHIYDSYLESLCDVGHMGTLYEAASTYDPVFWVIHPNIERAWQGRRINQRDFDYSRWSRDPDCFGANTADFIQPFRNLVDYDDEFGVKGQFYSNADLVRLLDPHLAKMPYTYDTLRWPHCEALGYSMGKFVNPDDVDDDDTVSATDGGL